MITLSEPMQSVMLCVLVVLILLILACLVYAIISHRFTDKIVAANMIGSLTMNIMVIFALYLGQSYILDSGMIIALLSFLSVIVLCRVVTDHIFGQLRHMRDKENGEISAEKMAHVGTEHHEVHRTGGEMPEEAAPTKAKQAATRTEETKEEQP
ncbi:MAG: MrpF/PhaF family protein [Faecalibacterium sp.]